MAYVEVNTVDKTWVKNKMANVAKIFNLDLDVEFEISVDGGLTTTNKDFRFTKSGLEVRVFNNWEPAPLSILEQLLLGKNTVKKKPWKATRGDIYYVPIIRGDEKSHRYIYDGKDEEDYNNGLMCQTEQQAKALSKTLIKVARNFQGMK